MTCAHMSLNKFHNRHTVGMNEVLCTILCVTYDKTVQNVKLINEHEDSVIMILQILYTSCVHNSTCKQENSKWSKNGM